MTGKNKKYLCALDIGTSKIVALIGEVQDAGDIHVVGMGQAPSRGIRNGMVTNIDMTAEAIRQAIVDAELMADCTVKGVIIGIAGNHVRSMNSQAVVKIKDGEVTKADIDRALEAAKTISIPPDHQVLHTVMQEYIIDNQPGVREPLGMSGTRLEIRVHIITGSVNAIQNIEKCVQRVGLSPEAVVLQSLASAEAVLTEDEKELGVCCIDIGCGTTDIAVYTDGAIRHTAVIPGAGEIVTKDLAQALRTPREAADYIKTHHGAAIENLDDQDVMVEVPSAGDQPPRQIQSEILVSIIKPRMNEIMEIVINELHHAGFPEEILSSGVVITGGTSLLRGMTDLAEDTFNLAARIGVPRDIGGLSDRLRNPRYATAIGLLYLGLERESRQKDANEHQGGGLFAILQRKLHHALTWIGQRF